MKLSIIIPVYNVEKYIEKCIRSCESQDINKNEYEVIVVNDGSPDSSLAIVEKLAKEYNNIIVISQQNSGLSVARNTGLNVAKGDYVWFVDSDDWIEENCLGRLSKLFNNRIDIFQLNYQLVFEESGEIRNVTPPFCGICLNGIEVTKKRGLPTPAQFSIYRRNFLIKNHLYFYPGIYHEDSEFKPRVTYLAEKIYFDDQVSYYYLQRLRGNIMSTYSLKRAADSILINKKLLDFSDSITDVECLSYFYWLVAMNFNDVFIGYHKLTAVDQQKLYTLIRENKKMLGVMIQSPSIKHKIEGYCFLINVKLGLKLHKIFKLFLSN